MKTCSKCGIEKPEEDFYKAATTLDGRHPWCKSCHKAWSREWAKKNPEKRRESSRRSHAKNREKRNAAYKEYAKQHPAIVRAAQKRWDERNPEYRARKVAEYRARDRDAAFMAYGGFRCACCGEMQPMFLTIDHVNNDGAMHRKIVGGKGGSSFFQWLRRNKYPPGFQVLCRNCNWGKHVNGGVCPHQRSEGSSTIPSGSTLQANGSGSAERLALSR
jgi:hypothetical protein